MDESRPEEPENYFGLIRPTQKLSKEDRSKLASKRSLKPLRVLLNERSDSGEPNFSAGGKSDTATNTTKPGALPANKQRYESFSAAQETSQHKAQASKWMSQNESLKRLKIARKLFEKAKKPLFDLRFIKNKLIITSVLAALLIISTGLTFIFHRSSGTSHSPDATTALTANSSPAALFSFYQKQLDFSLYNPKTLPKGFTVDTSSFKLDNGLLNFYIKAGNSTIISVAEQKKTTDFIAPKAMPASTGKLGTVTFITSSGNGSLFQSGPNSIALLETETSLIICNVNTVRSIDAESIIRSFERVN